MLVTSAQGNVIDSKEENITYMFALLSIVIINLLSAQKM